MLDDTKQIIETSSYSVREFSNGTWGGMVGSGIGMWYGGIGDLLPAWGTAGCDWQLRLMDSMLHNQLWAGARDIYIQKILSTPYEISGGRNLTFKWQDVFMESEFGGGYDELVAPFITDYLTLNRGGFMEIISYGDPSEPLKDGARVLGLAHLDAMRIVFTGNLEYPFIYYSEETTKAHRLHRTRVIHMTHSPSPDTRMFGMGRSPLYSAISSVNAQILLGRHQNEMLSDLPPPGLIIFTNVKGEDVRNAMTMFEAQRRKEGQNVYRAPMQIEGKDPAQPVTVTFTPLSQVPADFDRQKYMEIDVNLMALNTQLDPQDLWPLTGQAMGTGTQSRVLSQKTQIKGPGYLLTRLERAWNKITPRPLEFKYKAQNAEQDLETAAIAEKWTTIIAGSAYLSPFEARQLAANQIPAFADVLMDEAGNVRLPDDDPKVMADVTADDNVQLDGTNSPIQAIPDAMLQLPGGQPPPPNTAPPVVGSPAPKPDTNPVPELAEVSPKAPVEKPEAAPVVDPSADFKATQALLDASMITIGEAQRRMNVPVDPVLANFYMLDGVPVPPDKMPDIWQSKFGRGVVGFDAVVANEPQTTNVNYEVTKEYTATKTAFTDDIAAILEDASDGSVSKASFSARMRSSINTYGKAAYLDGLAEGGVKASEYDDTDSSNVADLLAYNSQFVTSLAKTIYAEDGSVLGGADFKAGLWGNKTLNDFYYKGIESADKNGVYEFAGEDGDESCDTCKDLKGTTHRMSWYVKNELRPGVDTDNFDCGGWQCKHFLEKKT